MITLRSWVIVSSTAALVSCGGGAGGPGPDQRHKYEEFDCPPPIGKIFREDCEKSALQYQGESFQGSVGAAGVGASAEYRQTAIREADALVQLLKEQRTNLCNNFNTCKLTVPEYREEQELLDDSFVALMALKDKMAAMDAQGATLLLEELRSIRTKAREAKHTAPPADLPPVATTDAKVPVEPPPPVSTPPTPTASAGEGLLPETIPADRSAVPKTTDWDATGPSTLPGFNSHGCEVKIFKEWLRVSCRGANSSGGTPTGVQAQCGNDTFTFANPKTKVASVVTPLIKGHRCNAAFSWTDSKQTLVVDWSTGSQGRVRFE